MISFEYNSNTIILVVALVTLINLLVVKSKIFSDSTKAVISFIFAISGFSFFLSVQKAPVILGLLPITVGFYFAWIFSVRIKKNLNIDEVPNKFIYKISLNGALISNFKSISLITILALLMLEISNNSAIGGYSTIILCLCAIMFFYDNFPIRLNRERDFLFIFFVFLVIFFILPFVLIEYFVASGPSGQIIITRYLSIPLSHLINFLGYESISVGDMLIYENSAGEINRIYIATSCSGLQSMIIFVSAFFSFCFVEFNKYDINLALLLILGLLTSYFANLIRMTTIVVVGIHWGIDALFWTHANVGWLIFFFWIFIFWSFLFRYLNAIKVNTIKS